MKLLQAFFLVMLAGFLTAPTAYAAAEGEELDPIHHSADGYYLDFMPIGKVELPRLFLVRRADGSLGFDAYAGTLAALRSGEYVPEIAHGEVQLEDITHGDENVLNDLIASGHHLDAHLVPAGGGHVIIDFSITRHLVFAILGGLLVVLIFTSLARKYTRGVGRETAPHGVFQNLFETLVLFVRDEIAKPNLGEKHYRKFLPYLLTAFFFILICNLLGLVPFGATATSNLMVTAVLATFTFILTQFNASADHWKHLWPSNVPLAVRPILFPVEVMGLFTKPIALAIRLFANLTAGHLVILSLIGLIFSFTNIFGPAVGYGVAPVSIAFSLFIYLLEILVAFIQAYIFTMLSALFIGMAVEEHEHHHDEAHDHHHGALQPAEHAVAAQPILSGNGAKQPQPVVTA